MRGSFVHTNFCILSLASCNLEHNTESEQDEQKNILNWTGCASLTPDKEVSRQQRRANYSQTYTAKQGPHLALDCIMSVAIVLTFLRLEVKYFPSQVGQHNYIAAIAVTVENQFQNLHVMISWHTCIILKSQCRHKSTLRVMVQEIEKQREALHNMNYTHARNDLFVPIYE